MESAQWTNSAPAPLQTGADALPERVIGATRRPDGSWRKEVRVRAGYVNQDDVGRFESRGSSFRAGMPKLPPGMSEEEDVAGKAASLSKSAKKNAKRKEAKKQEESDLADPVAATAKQFEGTHISSSSPGAAADPKAEIEKKSRNLRKKVKQCEETAVKKAAGATLTAEQEEKLSKLPEMQQELAALDAELAK
mmetsp:Transcript_23302/g.38976  ORF Transcript_23302/g.38976 Transcript_23302/m.38976 type:complete len:193 (-) Transcript_23302:158-736(-)|eukprot:CAMPEP_0198209680 /NCGR_PEP_ID=MMETSP1445-20131203/17664_1 /TAXON_ID=36898 /ORGANISM="Pyramimonas sp., Strain CCMP2087" /LENGTH=192 /DNA_ID=CAMNT_0043883533 /DNA_START=214 /DNA_END=795 /DNA_ORIENTATION=-